MATSEDVPKLGGYDYEFTIKVPEDLKCSICRLTLRDPIQIEGCGHRLCKICMESLFRFRSPTCPVDRTPLSREKIFQDAACHRRILNLPVKCSHSGCSWTGELRAVKEHQSGCLFKVIKCSNVGCTKMLRKRDMKTHETSECSWRKVDCEYCQESVIMNQKQKHFENCRTFPVLCTNKCGLRDIPREKLEAHILDECPATEVQCEYKNLGCEEVFPRSAAKSHSQTQIESHLSLALRGLEATQHQVHKLETVVKEQSQQIEELISKAKKQSEKMERLMQSTAQDEALERKRRGSMIQIFPTPFQWEISYNNADSKSNLDSEPFYLFKCGYKFRLRISSSVLSWKTVYITVVRGEFDDSLSWPCKEKVRVTVTNRKRLNLPDKSVVIDFEEKPLCRPQFDFLDDYRSVLVLAKMDATLCRLIGTLLLRVSIE